MSPQTRTRLVGGLFGAALPTIAFTQIAFYAWSDSGPWAASILHDARWWIGGAMIFVALVLAAGFIGTDEARPATPRKRGISFETRARIAWTLLTVAFVAYLFWHAAFRSWSASLPFLISFHFLSFQDWRWWVGALITSLGLFLAAVLVMAGELKIRTLPVTPIDDPTHVLRLDETGNEMALPPERDRIAAPADIEDPRIAAWVASEAQEPVPDVGWIILRWLRFVLAGLLVLMIVHYWLMREISFDYVLALAIAYAFALFSWWLRRTR